MSKKLYDCIARAISVLKDAPNKKRKYGNWPPPHPPTPSSHVAHFVAVSFVEKQWDLGEPSPTVLAKFPYFFNGEHLKNVTIPSHHLPHLAQMPHHPHTSIASAHSLLHGGIAGPIHSYMTGVMICDIEEEENCKEQKHDDNWTVKRLEDTCVLEDMIMTL